MMGCFMKGGLIVLIPILRISLFILSSIEDFWVTSFFYYPLLKKKRLLNSFVRF